MGVYSTNIGVLFTNSSAGFHNLANQKKIGFYGGGSYGDERQNGLFMTDNEIIGWIKGQYKSLFF